MTCDWICNKIMSCLHQIEREREREHPEASGVCLLTHVSWDHPWALIFSLKPCLLSKTISSWFLLAMQSITWTEVPMYRWLYGRADCPHELITVAIPEAEQYMIFTTVQNIEWNFLKELDCCQGQWCSLDTSMELNLVDGCSKSSYLGFQCQ